MFSRWHFMSTLCHISPVVGETVASPSFSLTDVEKFWLGTFLACKPVDYIFAQTCEGGRNWPRFARSLTWVCFDQTSAEVLASYAHLVFNKQFVTVSDNVCTRLLFTHASKSWFWGASLIDEASALSPIIKFPVQASFACPWFNYRCVYWSIRSIVTVSEQTDQWNMRLESPNLEQLESHTSLVAGKMSQYNVLLYCDIFPATRLQCGLPGCGHGFVKGFLRLPQATGPYCSFCVTQASNMNFQETLD